MIYVNINYCIHQILALHPADPELVETVPKTNDEERTQKVGRSVRGQRRLGDVRHRSSLWPLGRRAQRGTSGRRFVRSSPLHTRWPPDCRRTVAIGGPTGYRQPRMGQGSGPAWRRPPAGSARSPVPAPWFRARRAVTPAPFPPRWSSRSRSSP